MAEVHYIRTFVKANQIKGKSKTPRGRFHSKVIGSVVFLGYKILILVFLGSSGKFCAEMKFWYILGSTHFPYRVKMKNSRKAFSKLDKIVRQTVIRLFNVLN